MLILNIQVLSNLVFVIKSYKPGKIYLILANRGKHPLKVLESQRKSHHGIQRIREQYSKYFKLLSTKCGISCLFVFCFFFPRGNRIDQVVLECRKRAHSNGNEKF